MSTKSLIDRIVPYAPGWSRTGTRSIARLIQDGQDELMDWDSPNMIFTGTDNKGWPPFLKTTSGTYRYEIKDANLSTSITQTIGGVSYAVRCRYVNKIFVDTTTDYDFKRRWIGESYIATYNNPYRTSNSRVEVANIPVKSSPALETTNAYVDFPEDPGTTTEIFFCEFVWEPMRITSESIPLCVPQIYETALRKYVIGTIQELSSGKSSDQLVEFYKLWVPRYRSEISRGAVLEDSKVELSPF